MQFFTYRKNNVFENAPETGPQCLNWYDRPRRYHLSFFGGEELMLPCSIRARLLGLVVAAIVPFTLLTGIGLWNQLQSEHAPAIQRALNEARLIATQVDDHV